MNILIVDKNRRVGEFIKRELEKDFHRVNLAESAQSLFLKFDKTKGYDLLIIDPDLPDAEKGQLIRTISERIPVTPIIIHSYMCEDNLNSSLPNLLGCVEKSGNSIDGIKATIRNSQPTVNLSWVD